jgi:predicted 2-oxoglutarate/Fe(II)-dependent dioxygenase YbiX
MKVGFNDGFLRCRRLACKLLPWKLSKNNACLSELPPLLSSETVVNIIAGLDQLAWEDGMDTAGKAQTRKKNEQLTVNTAEARPLLLQVSQAILQHPEVGVFAEPKKMSRVMFSRYGEGMHYGRHNDAPITAGGGQGHGRAILREMQEAIRDAAMREAEGEEAIRLRRIRGDLMRRWAK